MLNFRHRKAMSKLRLSDHKLHVETGRHTKALLEDEIHFIYTGTYTAYSESREVLFSNIESDVRVSWRPV